MRYSPFFLACALALGLVGCKTVDFTEKRHLADPVMELSDGASETHFQRTARRTKSLSARRMVRYWTWRRSRSSSGSTFRSAS